MMLNMKAIKFCLEKYRYHLCHGEAYDIGDEDYREAMRTIKEIELMLIEKVAATHSREQLVARMKEIKIQELKFKIKYDGLDNALSQLLDEGFFPLDQECETYMSEQVGMADHVILP